MFYLKGDGKFDSPYRLDPEWKKLEFSATEAVVLYLAVYLNPDFLKPNMHTIWLDNLFTKIRLLEALRERGIGAAGAVRPPNYQLPREERLAATKKRQESKKREGSTEGGYQKGKGG